MQIVTDSGTDLSLSKGTLADLNIHIVPLTVQLGDATYREGVDIQPADFYPLLDESEDMPTTSQPSIGEFTEIYKKIAEVDADTD